jgi:hypothetical protein
MKTMQIGRNGNIKKLAFHMKKKKKKKVADHSCNLVTGGTFNSITEGQREKRMFGSISVFFSILISGSLLNHVSYLMKQ